jgi:cobalt/nickel transport system ATP-binding protein
VNAIALHGVGYRYADGTPALRDVNLAVEMGEKVAIVGSNGAGKSTLIELISGFRFPFQGHVEVLGESLGRDSAPQIRKHLGLVFQDPDDQVFMPRVWDDVAFGPKNLRWTVERTREAVEYALRELRILDLRDRAPHRLSYGQKKRVAIAGILAMDPEILLLDEPTTGLDPRTRSELLRKLSEMPKTMLVTTHHVDDLIEFVDRIVVLNGTVIADGAPRDVLLKEQVLEEADLEVPTIARLFRVLRDRGFPVDDLPLSIDEAVIRLMTQSEPPLPSAEAAGKSRRNAPKD